LSRDSKSFAQSAHEPSSGAQPSCGGVRIRRILLVMDQGIYAMSTRRFEIQRKLVTVHVEHLWCCWIRARGVRMRLVASPGFFFLFCYSDVKRISILVVVLCRISRCSNCQWLAVERLGFTTPHPPPPLLTSDTPKVGV
jgi:hypothetical protein